jgi:hypothetical protein
LEASHDIHHIGLGNVDLSFTFIVTSRLNLDLHIYLDFIGSVPLDRTVRDTATNVSSPLERHAVPVATSVHSLTSALSG